MQEIRMTAAAITSVHVGARIHPRGVRSVEKNNPKSKTPILSCPS